jgi:hypothetical protein
VLIFQVESWSAIAPGLESRDDWERWLQHPVAINEPLGKIPLKNIPALLRRRFNTLGKCAMGAAMPLVEGIPAIPSIFASRHGDTELTFSLLEAMGQGEPMSPTGFSLAVHNAVSGLFSIARNDTSEVTSIAAMEGLVLQTLFEAIGQLQSTEKVLCVIYDTPLPDFYKKYCSDVTESFPYAIAMILGSKVGISCSLEQTRVVRRRNPSDMRQINSEPMTLIGLLAGVADEIELTQNGVKWRLTRPDSKC